MSKRKSYDIRNEHLAMGAVCIKVDWSKVGLVLSGVDGLSDADKNEEWGRGDPRKTYETMERKGFRFTADTGCFAPTSRYTMKSGGANERGYQLSFFAKYGFMLSQPDSDEMPDASDGDAALQLSHRCHRRWCCRLDHLCVEPRWRNAARNHCLGPCEVNLPGLGVTKTCGCSLQYHFMDRSCDAGPPCVRAWSPSPDVVPVDIGEIVTSTGEIKTLLSQTGFPSAYIFPVWEKREAASRARQARELLKKQKGKALQDGLIEAGLVSPDLKLSKHAKLRDAKDVPFDANPKVLAYAEYDSDDEAFEPSKGRRRKLTDGSSV